MDTALRIAIGVRSGAALAGNRAPVVDRVLDMIVTPAAGERA